MKQFVRLLMALASAALASTAWSAGPAPANFDQCVQQGMKGVSDAHLFETRAACRESFPVAVELKESVDYRSGDLSYAWCKTGAGTVSVCLERNDSGYEITSARLMLSERPCASGTTSRKGVAYRFLGTQTDTATGTRFSVPAADAERVKCVYATWYGVKKQPVATAAGGDIDPTLADKAVLARQ
jgi:hypothetical protein